VVAECATCLAWGRDTCATILRLSRMSFWIAWLMVPCLTVAAATSIVLSMRISAERQVSPHSSPFQKCWCIHLHVQEAAMGFLTCSRTNMVHIHCIVMLLNRKDGLLHYYCIWVSAWAMAQLRSFWFDGVSIHNHYTSHVLVHAS
jgi:hypothetical protein